MGAAVLFDRETTIEIDALRRALGEPDMARIPPHLTLVPPVNVADVDGARSVMRAAAHATPPFGISVGPVANFLPDNPVVYLAVSDGVDAVRALRDRVFQPPLARTLTWPFVPHVTLADGIEPERVAAAPALLCDYARDIAVNAIHLLEERGRVWEVLAAFPLGPPAVIGRGGEPLELETLAIDDTVTITARRDGVDVGAAQGWLRGTGARLTRIDVVEEARRGGIGTHLLAAFQSWAAEGGAREVDVDPGCDLDDDSEAFLSARGWSGVRPRRAL